MTGTGTGPAPAPAALGIDAGSTTCKAVVVDRQGAIVASAVERAEPRIADQAAGVRDRLLQRVGRPGEATAELPVAATGYGRKLVVADRRLTEITCHARGAFRLTGRPGMLIDIGGQDTKVIQIGQQGQVVDFSMNDKCAAGTGRFLEVSLARLGVPWEQVAALVAGAARAAPISSTCTVFAESEVISRVASGEPLAEIVKGLHRALAARVVALAGRVPAGLPLLLSGGVALDGAMVDALAEAAGQPVVVLDDPQLVGALGAALALLPAIRPSGSACPSAARPPARTGR